MGTSGTKETERKNRLIAKLRAMGVDVTGEESCEELKSILSAERDKPSRRAQRVEECKLILRNSLNTMGICYSANDSYEKLRKIYEDEIKHRKEIVLQQETATKNKSKRRTAGIFPQPLYLDSKRGMRIDQKTPCSVCGVSTSPVWRYTKSNKGVVFLCSRCKPVTKERTADRIDALDLAFQGGKFDGNRRRH